MSLQQENRKRIDSLQTVRALAFIGIFTSHCGLGQFGCWGVSVFLVLSGFVMTYTYYEKELSTSVKDCFSFSKKKISRLYPLHILTMVFALFFIGRELYYEYSVKKLGLALGKVILNVFLVQSWVPTDRSYFSLNGVAWYLSVCVFIYFMFPIVLKRVKKIKSIYTAILAILIVYGIQVMLGLISQNFVLENLTFHNIPKWLIYICPAFRLGDFLIGCLLGYIYLHKKMNIHVLIASFLEILTLIAIWYSQVAFARMQGLLGAEYFRYTMLYTPTTILLVYLFAMKRGIISGILTNKPILYLGYIGSYGFLFHQLCGNYCDYIAYYAFRVILSPWQKFAIIFPVTLALTEGYLWCERQLKKRNSVEKTI